MEIEGTEDGYIFSDETPDNWREHLDFRVFGTHDLEYVVNDYMVSELQKSGVVVARIHFIAQLHPKMPNAVMFHGKVPKLSEIFGYDPYRYSLELKK